MPSHSTCDTRAIERANFVHVEDLTATVEAMLDDEIRATAPTGRGVVRAAGWGGDGGRSARRLLSDATCFRCRESASTAAW